MSCTKSFTLSPQANDMPLDNAVVLGSSIYGTMGPYVMKFSAVTGVFESSARVTTLDIRSPTCITEMDGTIWVGTRYFPAMEVWPDVNDLANSGFGLFPVNPTTLAIGTPVDLVAWSALEPLGTFTVVPNAGPHVLASSGGYIYWFHRWDERGGALRRYNPTTGLGVREKLSNESGDSDMNMETLHADATHVYYGLAGWVQRVVLSTITDANNGGGTDQWFSVSGAGSWEYVRSIAPVGGDVAYAVGNFANLFRGTFGGASTTFNLATLQADARPTRIRYNPNTARLYIPCPGHGIVIVWNPANDTGTVVSGLGSPIDVVFTATKVWAVQNSSTPLVDIT